MQDKPKRKHNTHILLNLKLMLTVFISWTLFSAFFPMIWFAPPLFALTPFIYVGLSLLWIPLAWRTIQRIKRDKIINGLVYCCLASSIIMSGLFLYRFSNGLQCHSTENWRSDYLCSAQCSDVEGFYASDVNGIMIVREFIPTVCIDDWFMF